MVGKETLFQLTIQKETARNRMFFEVAFFLKNSAFRKTHLVVRFTTQPTNIKKCTHFQIIVVTVFVVLCIQS